MSNLMKRAFLILMATLLILSLSSATFASAPEQDAEAVQEEYAEGVAVPYDELPDYVREWYDQLKREESESPAFVDGIPFSERYEEAYDWYIYDESFTGHQICDHDHENGEIIYDYYKSYEMTDEEKEMFLQNAASGYEITYEYYIIYATDDAKEIFLQNAAGISDGAEISGYYHESTNELLIEDIQEESDVACDHPFLSLKSTRTVETRYALYNLCRMIEEYKVYECNFCPDEVPIRRTTVYYEHDYRYPEMGNGGRWFVDCWYCGHRNWLEPEEELAP